MLLTKRAGKVEMTMTGFLLALAILAAALLVHGEQVSTAGDTITPDNKPMADGQTLVSAGGTFEMGFFSPGNSEGRYLGIWYKDVPPEQTVVWVANRDFPLNSSKAVVNLTADGNLLILSDTGSIIWSTGTSNAMNPAVELLDSGNLVLSTGGASKSLLWQSFDYPTNTFLPGMKLGWDLRNDLDRKLTSWKSASDPSPGDYSHGMDLQGVPQSFNWNGSDIFFRGGPWNGHGFTNRPEMSTTGLVEFRYVANQDEVYYTFELANSSVLSRGVLTEAGVLQRFVWTKESNKWSLYWSAPQDTCDSYANCGANGACTTNYSPDCVCLKRFVPKSPKDWSVRAYSDGCVRRTALNCSSGDGFLALHNLKWPDSRYATLHSNMTLDQCRDWCLKNCTCTAYATISGESACLTWTGDLVDSRVFSKGGDDLYVRLASSELDFPRGDSNKHKPILVITIPLVLGSLLVLCIGMLLWKKSITRKRVTDTPTRTWKRDFPRGDPNKQKPILVITIPLVLGSLLVLCIGMLLWKKSITRKRVMDTPSRTRKRGQINDASGRKEDKIELPLFDIATIKIATDDFSIDNKLGEGGFGPVYKGKLEDGQEIAVKVLSKSSKQGTDEFKTEVTLIAQLQHRNLVRLLGCCIENEERMLIYEYLQNKSLDVFIFDREKSVQLNWQKRLDIVMGIARGLVYLHHYSRLKIIHRDLKAGNILLDQDMSPKISDFGTARIVEIDQVEENTTRLVGTYGYMSPEYAMNGIFSVKSDVYSFGVLVLEICSGKKNRVSNQADLRMNLLGYAWSLWQEGRCLELLDEAMGSSYSVPEMVRCIQVGLLCVQEASDDRPTMEQVVLMLGSGDVALPQPRRPGLYMASTFAERRWSYLFEFRTEDR